MWKMNMKELYLFKSFDELLREAHINLIHESRDRLFPAAQEAFYSGLLAFNNRDEEMAFIQFHRHNLMYRHLDCPFLKERLIDEFDAASLQLKYLRISLQKCYNIRNGNAPISLLSVIREIRTYLTTSNTIPKEKIYERMEQLQVELADLRVNREQKELEIVNIDNLTLQQRFKDILDNLLQELLEKEREYQQLQEMLKAGYKD